MAATILIIEDRTSQSFFLRQQFEDQGYEVLTAETGKEGLSLFWTHDVDVVLLDWLLPDTKGLAVLQEIKKDDDQVPVIMMTAYAEVEIAVEAMRLGAFDYIRKPFDLAELQQTVDKAVETLSMKREIQRLRGGDQRAASQWIVGSNPEMRRVANVVGRVAPTDANVLIQGESGTGKEVVAQEIHRRSHRSHRPFLPINCAAIPDQLLESELFGFEAGAFTGARRQRKGLLEVADGGTVFLDEIASMPLEMQAKILRVLEDRTLRRVGGNNDIHVDVRFVSASNQDLARAIEEGTFREDLYWRLGVITIQLVPLRERRADIGLFVAAFIEQFNQATGKNIRGISGEALELMRMYHWPGNIRELRNVIERAVILCDGDEITVSHLPREIATQRAKAVQRPSAEAGDLSGSAVAPSALARPRATFDEETRRTLHAFFEAVPVGAKGAEADQAEGFDASQFAESGPEEQAQVLLDLLADGEDYHRLWLGAELLRTLISEKEKLMALKAAFEDAEGDRFPLFLLTLALAYEGAGDYASAMDYLLQVLALDSDSVYAYYDLGWVQRQLGRHGDAASSFRRALSLRPDYVEAQNQLGITYFEQGDRLRALTAFEAALALEPDNPHHYFNIGYVHKMLGNYDAAEAAFSRALEIDPAYKEAAAHRAQVEKARETSTLAILDRLALFADLPLEHRLIICEHLKSVTCEPGDVVIRQGEPGDAFYIVEDGRLQVSIAGQHGEEIVTAELEKGAYFGEIALLGDGSPRTATVKALTPVRLLMLCQEQFEEINAQIPTLAESLVQTRNARLQQDVLRTLEESGQWKGGTPARAPSGPAGDAGEEQDFSVLTAVVLPSAAFTQALGRRAMLTFLKEFYLEMVQVIGERGVVHQYAGDRLVALFDEPQGAVEVALHMRETFGALARRWARESPVIPCLGLGVATGPLQMDGGSLVGPAMGISQGLCAVEEGGALLIDESTARALADTPIGARLQELSGVQLPGLDEPPPVYSLSAAEDG